MDFPIEEEEALQVSTVGSLECGSFNKHVSEFPVLWLAQICSPSCILWKGKNPNFPVPGDGEAL